MNRLILACMALLLLGSVEADAQLLKCRRHLRCEEMQQLEKTTAPLFIHYQKAEPKPPAIGPEGVLKEVEPAKKPGDPQIGRLVPFNVEDQPGAKKPKEKEFRPKGQVVVKFYRFKEQVVIEAAPDVKITPAEKYDFMVEMDLRGTDVTLRTKNVTVVSPGIISGPSEVYIIRGEKGFMLSIGEKLICRFSQEE